MRFGYIFGVPRVSRQGSKFKKLEGQCSLLPILLTTTIKTIATQQLKAIATTGKHKLGATGKCWLIHLRFFSGCSFWYPSFRPRLTMFDLLFITRRRNESKPMMSKSSPKDSMYDFSAIVDDLVKPKRWLPVIGVDLPSL